MWPQYQQQATLTVLIKNPSTNRFPNSKNYLEDLIFVHYIGKRFCGFSFDNQLKNHLTIYFLNNDLSWNRCFFVFCFFNIFKTIAQAITFENHSFELSLVCLQIVMNVAHIYQGN